MKLTILFSLLLSFSISISAQYIPFPDSVASWSLRLNLYQEEPYTQNEFGYIQQVTGDTMIIDGESYLKVFQKLTWWTEDYFYEGDNGEITEYHISGNYNDPPLLIGGLRQDINNKKIFFIRPSSVANNLPVCLEPFLDEVFVLDEEFLLFDFDIEVGDTVTLGGGPGQDFYITQMDSVQYNDGIFRKRYSTGNSFPSFQFIEGIGTSNGLFAPIRADFVEGHFCTLNCFSTNGEYIIGDGIYNCDSIEVLTPVVEIDHQPAINIFPNPFDDIIQVTTSNTLSNNQEIVMRDILGKVIKRKSFENNEILEIATDQLISGVYFISVYSNGHLRSCQKMLKLE